MKSSSLCWSPLEIFVKEVKSEVFWAVENKNFCGLFTASGFVKLIRGLKEGCKAAFFNTSFQFEAERSGVEIKLKVESVVSKPLFGE